MWETTRVLQDTAHALKSWRKEGRSSGWDWEAPLEQYLKNLYAALKDSFQRRKPLEWDAGMVICFTASRQRARAVTRG